VFSLIEVLIATVILLIGLVGVAQLVPASSSSIKKAGWIPLRSFFAQRELDQMLAQPLTAASFLEANGALCASSCNFGDAASPGTVVGSPIIFCLQPALDRFLRFGCGQLQFHLHRSERSLWR